METFVLIALGVSLVLEFSARLLFWEPLYSVGPVILTADHPELARPVAALGTVIQSKRGRFKVVAVDRVLARQRYSFFDRYQSGVVGTFDWSSGEAKVTARLSPVWVVYPLFTIPFLWGLRDDPTFALGMVAMMIALCAFYVFLSRTHIERLVREYLETVGHA